MYKFGNWPLIDKNRLSNRSKRDTLITYCRESARLGLSANDLFSIIVEQDSRNTTKTIIYASLNFKITYIFNLDNK